MDKYRPTISRRKQIVLDQIGECQTLIYRNDLENLTFKQKNDEDKQLEVQTNNNILAKKIDGLLTELDSLEKQDETSGDPPIQGSAV